MCTFSFLMEHPVTSIFQVSESLLPITILHHIEEDEAEEDQKRRNKEVLQPLPWSVRVRHTDNIQNLLFFQQTNSYTVHINIMLHLQCLSCLYFHSYTDSVL